MPDRVRTRNRKARKVHKCLALWTLNTNFRRLRRKRPLQAEGRRLGNDSAATA